jgi:hypothetical protein
MKIVSNINDLISNQTYLFLTKKIDEIVHRKERLNIKWNIQWEVRDKVSIAVRTEIAMIIAREILSQT